MDDHATLKVDEVGTDVFVLSLIAILLGLLRLSAPNSQLTPLRVKPLFTNFPWCILEKQQPVHFLPLLMQYSTGECLSVEIKLVSLTILSNC